MISPLFFIVLLLLIARFLGCSFLIIPRFLIFHSKIYFKGLP